MAISFRYNDTTYELFSDVSVITNPSLNIAKDVAGLLYKFSVPLLTSREQTIGSYIYKAPSPTICVRHNNTTYYCARSREAISEYDIPAGTYTPSAFRALDERIINNPELTESLEPSALKLPRLLTAIYEKYPTIESFNEDGELINVEPGFDYEILTDNKENYAIHTYVCDVDKIIVN